MAPPARADDGTTLVAPPAAHTLGFRRVTTRQIALLLPGTRIETPGGIAVARLHATDDPDTRDDDDEVTLVALDAAGGKVFTNYGLLKAGTWSGDGTSLGPLSGPTDVALDRDGRVAVTDTGHGRVVLLQHDGSGLTAVRAFGGFSEPTGIAEDGRGGFWVCDRGANTVVHLDPATGSRSTFGLETGFERPVAIATVPEGDRLAQGKRRAVVIADRDGTRLRSFGPSGSLRATVSARELGAADARFDAVEIDYYANVYAVDTAAHRLHKFRDDLLPLATFGSEGTSAGEFRSPRGIAIHRRLGQVFVTEADGGQYLWVGTDVQQLAAEDRGGEVTVSFLLTEESRVSLHILDRRGREVAVILPERRLACGPQRGTWDGTDADGARVPPGDYLAEVRARATYSSGSRFEAKRHRAFTLSARADSP